MIGAAALRRILPEFKRRRPTLRINELRAPRDDTLHRLAELGIKVQQLPFYRCGFAAPNSSERELRKIALYAQGAIYLQSAASMLPVVALNPQPGETVLDLTAAPGSKTGQIAQAMRLKGKLVAIELDKIRFQRLRHNMRLLGIDEGAGFMDMHCGDAIKLVPQLDLHFDRILVDAPCSGEARFQKDDCSTFRHWSGACHAEYASIQITLLKSAWDRLKTGGILVYSTCTLAWEENEQVLIDFTRSLGIQCSSARFDKIQFPGVNRLPILGSPPGRDNCSPHFYEIIANSCRVFPTELLEPFFIASLTKI